MTDAVKSPSREARRAEQRSPLAVMTSRQTRMLRTAMGDAIAAALEEIQLVREALEPARDHGFPLIGTVWRKK